MIYYVDYATGANNTYTALTGCIASNPSGTITRINKTAHGLSTGNIVILSAFSTWLNQQWTVTYVDANNFDLQGAVWQTTADNNGTVQRVWGRQWSEPFDLTSRITNSSTTPIVAGDTIKVAKTSDPTSIGNATWTNKSITITLASAQTTLIDDVDSGWTANPSGDVTVTYNTTNKKSGTGRGIFTFDATPQTNLKQAYKTLPAALNLSSYDSITFWFTYSAVLADNNRLKIALCSDTTGDTIVDEFYIPQISALTGVISFNLTRNGGGSLGSNINSVALYTMGAAVTASSNYTLDNINACNTNGLHLNTLISKSSTAWNFNEVWCPIKSINGTTVTIDGSATNYTTAFGANLRGYYTTGTSPETVTTYIMNPYQPPLTTASNGFYDTYGGGVSGTSSSYINILGGWNKSTDTRDGMTFINMRGHPGGFYAVNTGYDYLYHSYFGVMRGGQAFNFSTSSGTGTTAQYKALDYSITTGCIGGGISGQFSAGWNLPTVNYQVINNCDYPGYSLSYRSPRVGTSGNIKFISNSNIQFNAISFPDGTKFYNIGMNNPTNDSYFFSDSGSVNADKLVYSDLEFRDCDTYLWVIAPQGASSASYGSKKFPNQFNNLTIVNHGSTAYPFYNGGGISYTGPNAAVPTIISNSSISGPTYLVSGGYNDFFIRDSSISTTFLYNNGTNYTYGATRYDRFNNSETDYRIYPQSFTSALTQSSVTHSGSGIAWQINITSSGRLSEQSGYLFKVSTVAFNAGSLVTYKIWVKKTHASNIQAKLTIPIGSIPGVSTALTATKANDTNWEELTLTFTPTKKGAVDIFVNVWAPTSPYTESVYVDDVTVTQA